MIFAPNFTEIGYVEKTHGTAGSLKLNIQNIKNSILKKMEFLFLKVDEFEVPFQIEQFNTNGFIIKLKGFDDPSAAQKLIGKTILFPIIEGEENIHTAIQKVFQPIDFWVYTDKDILIGKVQSIIEIPNNPLLEIVNDDATFEIPWTPDLIESIDKKKKVIIYRLPDGLLDL